MRRSASTKRVSTPAIRSLSTSIVSSSPVLTRPTWASISAIFCPASSFIRLSAASNRLLKRSSASLIFCEVVWPTSVWKRRMAESFSSTRLWIVADAGGDVGLERLAQLVLAQLHALADVVEVGDHAGRLLVELAQVGVERVDLAGSTPLLVAHLLHQRAAAARTRPSRPEAMSSSGVSDARRTRRVAARSSVRTLVDLTVAPSLRSARRRAPSCPHLIGELGPRASCALVLPSSRSRSTSATTADA